MTAFARFSIARVLLATHVLTRAFKEAIELSETYGFYGLRFFARRFQATRSRCGRQDSPSVENTPSIPISSETGLIEDMRRNPPGRSLSADSAISALDVTKIRFCPNLNV